MRERPSGASSSFTLTSPPLLCWNYWILGLVETCWSGPVEVVQPGRELGTSECEMVRVHQERAGLVYWRFFHIHAISPSTKTTFSEQQKAVAIEAPSFWTEQSGWRVFSCSGETAPSYRSEEEKSLVANWRWRRRLGEPQVWKSIQGRRVMWAGGRRKVLLFHTKGDK